MPTPRKIYSHLEHPEVRVIKELEKYVDNASKFIEETAKEMHKFEDPQEHKSTPHKSSVRLTGITRFFQSKPETKRIDHHEHKPDRASFITSTSISGFDVQKTDVEKLIDQLSPKKQTEHEHLISKATQYSTEINDLLKFITSHEFMSAKKTQEFARKLST